MSTAALPASHARKTTPTGTGLLGPAIQRFFCDYLINQRQLSAHTVAAYRDTFKLLLAFFAKSHRHRKLEELRTGDIDADCVMAFLDHLERSRHNGARSRNARLAAIRSFVRHAASSDPLLVPTAQRVLAIPVKRFERAQVAHLTRVQMQAILDAPDASTRVGLRDRVMLMLMYNTGARVSEIAALTIGDLRLETSGSIHLRGKGRKHRTVPLWRQTVRLLRAWLPHVDHTASSPVLPNAHARTMTRSGIEHRLRVAVARAARREPSLLDLRVSPHTIRHTTAMHLLQSRIDLSVIAMWLGHESIQTTHQYLNADLDTKKKALAKLDVPVIRRFRKADARPLVQFLERL